jgi:hypothetical protein
MSEEASGILSGDAVERRSERLFQRLDGARGVRRRISPCPNGPSSRSVKLAGIRTRRHTIGLMPTSQSLICKSGVGAGVRATAWLAVVGWLGCTRRAGVAGTGPESCRCLIGAQMPRPRCGERGLSRAGQRLLRADGASDPDNPPTNWVKRDNRPYRLRRA